MNTINTISLIQLPPPIHGASLINERVDSILHKSEEIDNKSFKLNYAKNFNEMHSHPITKLKYTAKLLASIICEYIKNKPRITYIAFSPFGLGFYRDISLVALAHFFSSQPYLHLHGTGLSTTKSKIKSALLKWMFKKSKLILISQSLYHDVEKFIPRNNITIVENCAEDPGEHKKIRSNIIKILYLANLDERKGIKIAISAFSKIRKSGHNAQLIIAGSDTALLTMKSLQEFINASHPEVKQDITLFGPAYGEDKTKLFMSSDIFLYPSQHDAAPLVVIEALSYGIPVICSSQGALPDMIKHGENGFISYNNSTADYSSFFRSCVDNIEVLSAAARKTYLEKYSPSVFEKKIQDLFLTGS